MERQKEKKNKILFLQLGATSNFFLLPLFDLKSQTNCTNNKFRVHTFHSRCLFLWMYVQVETIMIIYTMTTTMDRKEKKRESFSVYIKKSLKWFKLMNITCIVLYITHCDAPSQWLICFLSLSLSFWLLLLLLFLAAFLCVHSKHTNQVDQPTATSGFFLLVRSRNRNNIWKFATV